MFFQPLITRTHTLLLEIDYYMHKSNSTYYSDLDVSRTHLLLALLQQGLADDGVARWPPSYYAWRCPLQFPARDQALLALRDVEPRTVLGTQVALHCDALGQARTPNFPIALTILRSDGTRFYPSTTSPDL
jgi:hypothetical protein